MQFKRELETLDPRRAGQVKRYHTWPYLREQSVGEHCWNVARLLLAFWPECPRPILLHALFHDMGEVLVGDPPYPTKSMNPEMKKFFDEAEDSAHLHMCIPWALPKPVKLEGDFNKDVFKLADYADMWEFSLDEIALGNHNCTLVRERTEALLAEYLKKQNIPVEIRLAAARYIERRASLHTRRMRSTEPVFVMGIPSELREDSNRHAFQEDETSGC